MLLPVNSHLSITAIFRLAVLRMPQVVGGEAPIEGCAVTLQGDGTLGARTLAAAQAHVQEVRADLLTEEDIQDAVEEPLSRVTDALDGWRGGGRRERVG